MSVKPTRAQQMANEDSAEVARVWAKRCATLERELATAQATIAAAQWTPITPDNLPKVGDEIARFPADPSVRLCQVQVWQVGENAGPEQPFAFKWRLSEWTHFRPISPPAQASAAEKP